MGMRVRYARVSTVGQKLDVQMEHLADRDCIFHEKVSASSNKIDLSDKMRSTLLGRRSFRGHQA